MIEPGEGVGEGNIQTHAETSGLWAVLGISLFMLLFFFFFQLMIC